MRVVLNLIQGYIFHKTMVDGWCEKIAAGGGEKTNYGVVEEGEKIGGK